MRSDSDRRERKPCARCGRWQRPYRVDGEDDLETMTRAARRTRTTLTRRQSAGGGSGETKPCDTMDETRRTIGGDRRTERRKGHNEGIRERWKERIRMASSQVRSQGHRLKSGRSASAAPERQSVGGQPLQVKIRRQQAPDHITQRAMDAGDCSASSNSRKRKRCTLPVGVRGNSSIWRIQRGRL